MKYEFHVGDYVETKTGTIGYITSVLATGDAWWKCVSDCHDYQAGQEYSAMNDSPYNHFNRIGQYDFTKKDESKIEPLACETASDYSNEKLRKKINELVDAVNRLEGQVNEMA